MSKLWKIIIGVVIALVVLGAVGGAGFIAGRRSALRAFAQRPAQSTVQAPAGPANQGMNDRPRPRAFNPYFRPDRGQPFGRGFERGRPRPFGLLFVPFLLIGGLVRGLIALAFLALLISLTIYFYRRWQPTRLAAAPVAVSPAPVEVQSPPASAQAEDQAANEG